MDLKSLNRIIEQIADEKGLDKNAIIDVVESAIAAAYRKEYGKRGENIKAKLDLKTGNINFWKTRLVVDETMVVLVSEDNKEQREKIRERNIEGEEILPFYSVDRHILIKEAKEIKADVQLGEELEFPLEEHEDFGRIAAQAAKQVILQKIKEAERDSIRKEYQTREGEIVSGVIQRMERGNVYIDLGRAIGVMFFNETIPGEFYKIGERLRFYLLAVQEESGRLPGLVLSRSHPKFVSKLFEIEVPEIHEGTVEIKAIAREAGSRTKIAVASTVSGVDPIGACVGPRGTRVMAVTNELGNEKIDIIEWSEDPDKFVAASLSPAKAKGVEISAKREAKVFIPEDQLSLAIGKGGQNVRLAAKLTGWKIDVRSLSRPDEVLSEGVAAIEEETAVAEEISDVVEKSKKEE